MDSPPIRPSHSGARAVGLVGIVAVLLLGTTILLFGNGPLPVDVWWHDLMLAWRTDALIVLAGVMQFVGGPIPMTVIGLAIVIGLLLARRPRSALAVALAMLVAEALAAVLKVLVARPRPSDSLSSVSPTSFPSGHTTIAATTAVIVALLVARWAVWWIAAAWIILMGWSRTYLEAHWLTDTVGGALLGLATAMLVWGLIRAARAEETTAGDPLGAAEPSQGPTRRSRS